MQIVINIAVVFVLALFAIAGVLNISKAEEAFIIFDVQSLELHLWRNFEVEEDINMSSI